MFPVPEEALFFSIDVAYWATLRTVVAAFLRSKA